MFAPDRSQPARGLYDPYFEHDGCGIGFVTHVKGAKSHQIIQKGLSILKNLEHRGACGCDAETGDGAGILIQMPHDFFRAAAHDARLFLPSPGEYGTGLVFLPTDPAARQFCEETLEAIIRDEQQLRLGWRDVPTCPEAIGEQARPDFYRARPQNARSDAV